MRVVFSKVADIHYKEMNVIENIKIKLVSYPYYSKKHQIQFALMGKKNVKMFFKIYPKENIIFVFDFFIVRKAPKKLYKL